MKGKIRNIAKTGLSASAERIRRKLGISDQFIAKADSYLHYSNHVLFSVSGKFISACILISILLNNKSIILEPAINPPASKEFLFFRMLIEIANSFEGVIERYCGVPP